MTDTTTEYAMTLDPAPPPATGRTGWRDQKFAIKFAGSIAVIPTVLATQGMITVSTDVLHSPLIVALVLSGFLEGGLIAFALLARQAAAEGRPTWVDSSAVWVLSILSGLLSASHELIATLPDGSRGWAFTAPQLVAATLRMSAPLVAAAIWERVLVDSKREAAGRTASEIRLDHKCLAFGRSVQIVRRLDTGERTPGRVRRVRQWAARRRFDRQHAALLRRMPATDTGLRVRTMTWVAEVAGADALYLSGQAAGRPAMALPQQRARRAVSAPQPAADKTPDTEPVMAELVTDTEPSPDTSPVRQDIAPDTDRFSVALGVVRPRMSGKDMAEAMTLAGHEMSARTGQRLLADVRAHRPTLVGLP